MTSNARELAQIPSTPSGRRNVIINGAQQVAQRATSKADIGADGAAIHVTDRMTISCGGLSGRLTMSQDSDSPDGFANSLKFDCTTAQTSFDAGDFLWFQTRIEGQDLQRFCKGTSSAKNFIFSFYVKANSARTMIAELFDADNNRHVGKTFTTTTGWSRIEIDFGADTTGAFDDDGNLSLYVAFWLASGTTYSDGTLQTSWGSHANGNRNAGGSNFLSSTDNTLFITGMQLEVGSVATEFEHRSFGEELALCQRYYFAIETTASSQPLAPYGAGVSSTRVDFNYWLPVSMRAAPTVTVARLGLSTPGGSVTNSTGTDYAAGYQGGQHTNIRLGLDVASGLTANNPYFIRNQSGTGQSYIRCDAEL